MPARPWSSKGVLALVLTAQLLARAAGLQTAGVGAGCRRDEGWRGLSGTWRSFRRRPASVTPSVARTASHACGHLFAPCPPSRRTGPGSHAGCGLPFKLANFQVRGCVRGCVPTSVDARQAGGPQLKCLGQAAGTGAARQHDTPQPLPPCAALMATPQGLYECTDSVRVGRPASLSELRTLVSLYPRVKAVGTGHSYVRDLFCTGNGSDALDIVMVSGQSCCSSPVAALQGRAWAARQRRLGVQGAVWCGVHRGGSLGRRATCILN